MRILNVNMHVCMHMHETAGQQTTLRVQTNAEQLLHFQAYVTSRQAHTSATSIWKTAMTAMDPRLPAERGFNAADPIITIHVGEPHTSYYVHRITLCSTSDFFKTRLKPEWSKTDEADAELPVHEPEAFNIYANWLYMRGIPLTAPDNDDDELHYTDWRNLAAAFVVDEAVMDNHFKDTVMDALCAKARSRKGPTLWNYMNGMVAKIYEGTVARSPARSWLLGVFLHHAPLDALDPGTGRFAERVRLGFGACAYEWQERATSGGAWRQCTIEVPVS